MNKLVLALFAVAALAGCVSDDAPASAGCAHRTEEFTENPTVIIHTNMGNMSAEMFVDQVPTTACNFVALAEDGKFDDSPFHRIISNFMMQGGDYTHGTGTGGEAHEAYANSDGNINDEYSPNLKHDQKGTFSMANTGQLNSGSSQFFITFGPTNFLDAYNADGSKKSCGQPGVSCHAVFGQVTDGLEILDAVNQQAASQSGAPRVPVTFEGATVFWP